MTPFIFCFAARLHRTLETPVLAEENQVRVSRLETTILAKVLLKILPLGLRDPWVPPQPSPLVWQPLRGGHPEWSPTCRPTRPINSKTKGQSPLSDPMCPLNLLNQTSRKIGLKTPLGILPCSVLMAKSQGSNQIWISIRARSLIRVDSIRSQRNQG